MQGLDLVQQADWDDMKDVALNQIHAQAEKMKNKKTSSEAKPAGETKKSTGAEQGDKEASAAENVKNERTISTPSHYTPGELRTLLPGAGYLPGVYIKRNPASASGKNYQGFYPARKEGQGLEISHTTQNQAQDPSSSSTNPGISA